MGSLTRWPPNMNTKDCTQGFCSIYCPQWCNHIFPPPPSMDSSSSFSPLVIAIIGVLASAFLLVSYYAVISKLCRTTAASSRDSWPHNNDNENENENENEEFEPWNHARAQGLDEALIKLISIHKYKKGDKGFPSTDCSVCLGEFEEDEALRVLPKCSHSFHVPCIDKWLKTHSSCPLCRSNIVSMFTQTSDLEGGEGQDEVLVQVLADEIVERRRPSTRRSISMDYSRERRILIDEDCEVEECQLHGADADLTKDSSMGEEAYRVLQCVMRSTMMKRSFSSGRFSLPRHMRGRNSVIPV